MLSKKIGIYKITNTESNKVYIGQSLDLKRRMAKHIQALRNKNHTNQHLQLSFNEYGEDSFKFEIVEVLAEVTLLDEREMYWIDYYRSYDREFGYNIELGGLKTKREIPQETREKMSKARLGKKLPIETIEKMKQKKMPQKVKEQISKTMKEKGINIGASNPMYGKPGNMAGKIHSKEIRKKISENVKGKQKGENNAFWGKKHTKETLEKLSKAATGRRKGIKHTPEVIEQMRQKRREYWANKKNKKGE